MKFLPLITASLAGMILGLGIATIIEGRSGTASFIFSGTVLLLTSGISQITTINNERRKP